MPSAAATTWCPTIVEAIADAEGDVIGDDLLRLIFTACHPVLSADARVALTLKLLGGLSTAGDRARLPGARADRSRSASCAPNARWARPACRSRCRAAPTCAERLASVLEVVYRSSTRATPAPRGDDWMRPALMQDALRLGRMLAELAREDSEVHGLVALMELQASRAAARIDAQGRPVLLSDQDRTRWDRLLIRRGLAALERARALAVAARQPLGPYALQAAIAACHARAASADDTDWPRIVALYDALAQVAAVTGGATEPRGGGEHGVRAGGGAGDRRCPAARRRTARLPVAAQRARPTCWPSSAATTRPAPN